MENTIPAEDYIRIPQFKCLSYLFCFDLLMCPMRLWVFCE